MGNWFVDPDSEQLPLSDGQWIEVKKRLNVGEERTVMAQIIGEVKADGARRMNTETLGMGEVAAYLLDWSLTDKRGKAVSIEKESDKWAAIKQLDPNRYKEIETAIDAHKARVEAEIEASKKEKASGSGGEPALVAIS